MNATQSHELNTTELEASGLEICLDIARNLKIEREAAKRGLAEHLAVYRELRLAIANLCESVVNMQDLDTHDDIPELDYLSGEFCHLAWLARKLEEETQSYTPYDWTHYAAREIAFASETSCPTEALSRRTEADEPHYASV